jgi:hypothetical protein
MKTKPYRFVCPCIPFYKIGGPLVNGQPTTLAFNRGELETDAAGAAIIKGLSEYGRVILDWKPPSPMRPVAERPVVQNPRGLVPIPHNGFHAIQKAPRPGDPAADGSNPVPVPLKASTVFLDQPPRRDIDTWLLGLLCNRTVLVTEVRLQAAARGYSLSRVRRAKERLRVQSEKIGWREGWAWSLPIEDYPFSTR